MGTAPTERGLRMVSEVGGVGEVEKTYIDESKKKWGTGQMRSHSRNGDLRRTPDTLETLNGSYLGRHLNWQHRGEGGFDLRV